jgi:hypothetical protein
MNRQLQLALLLAGSALGLFGALRALAPLAGLIPSTAGMLQTTQEIRRETLGLETSVQQVERQLAGLAEQETLLKQQTTLIGQTLALLQQQEVTAKQATVHLRQLATLEERTVQLTTQADVVASQTAEVLRANKASLGRLANETARIEEGSVRMERQVDLLLGEMAKAERNFAPVKRWKNGMQEAKKGFTGWLEGVATWIDSWFH